MLVFLKSFLSLLLFALVVRGNDTLIDIKFQQNVTNCPMYTDECLIPIFISKNVKINELNVTSNRTDLFNFKIIRLCDENEIDCKFENEINDTLYARGLIIITSVIVGKGALHIQHEQSSFDHIVIIVQPQRIVDIIHRVYLSIFQTIISMIMGVLIDYEALKKILKMPIPVLIGFCAQYGCMPPLAFAATYLFGLSPVDALALFIYGCCPGGSASNNWTILFNGDIDLSAIMTFVSTLSSLVCMPLWLYTVGTIFTDATNIQIPFIRLIINLFITIGPCVFGLCLSRFFPNIKKFVLKIAKPFTLCAVLSFLAFTIYVKFYVFSLVRLGQWVIAPFVPWCGFAIGASVAFLFRLPFKQILTIALETGIQNVGIAFLIVFYNFPSPESDYAILPLISVSLLTTLPLWLCYFLLQIYRKIRGCFERGKDKTDDVAIEEQEKLSEYKEPSEASTMTPIYKNVVKV